MSRIKDHFTSRYGNDGVILEADWCLASGTRILTTDFIWKKIEDLIVGEEVIGFDENIRTHDGRKFKKSIVEKTKKIIKPCLKIVTEEGELICSKDHMFLSSRNGTTPTKWVRAQDMKVGNKLSKVSEVWDTKNTWESGWVGGFLDGEGYISNSNGFGVGQSARYPDNKKLLERICKILSTQTINTEIHTINTHPRQVVQVSLKGLRTAWQVIGMFQPFRLKDKLLRGLETKSIRSKRNRKVKILDIIDIGEHEVIAIQTSSKTFIAEGFLSHNCMLEVVVFAFLTQDPQLIKDIQDGIDIHCALASDLYGEKIEKGDPRRQQIKPGTFLCIYGGSANKFSKDFKVDLDLAKKFIDTFYSRYSTTKQWQQHLVKKVEASKVLIDEYTPKGFQKHLGYLDNITGRRFYFKTTDAPGFLVEQGIMTSFNPSEIKNYPVQSLATADIHMIALGKLFRFAIKHRDKFLMVNTVHDSVILDVRKKYLKKTCQYVKKVLESVVDDLKLLFDIDFNVKLSIDIKIGDSWGSCIDEEKYFWTITNIKN